jgi:hypothetical protein
MRIRFPLGLKGLLAASALGAGVVFWRVRASRRDELDRAWEAEIQGAVDEGIAAGRAAVADADERS